MAGVQRFPFFSVRNMITKKELFLLSIVALTVLPGAECGNLRNLGGPGSGTNGETLTSVNPNTAATGDPATTITLTGTRFTSSSVAYWNGAALTTTFVSSTSLTATIPASYLATAGTYAITVDGTPSLSFTVGMNAGPTSGTFAAGFFTFVNSNRTTLNQPAFVWDAKLAATAQQFATYMFNDGIPPQGPPGSALDDPNQTNQTIAEIYASQNGTPINPNYNAESWLDTLGSVTPPPDSTASGTAFASSLGTTLWIYANNNGTATYTRIGVGYFQGCVVVIAY